MKSKFEEARNTKMSDEEFKVLVLSYPIFLVAKADGEFDEDERNLLSTILFNFLNSIYGENIDSKGYDNLISNYLDDFEFLHKNESNFKNNLLEELKSFDKIVKDSISDLLNEIANISGGIHESESETIKYITNDFLF